MDRRWRPRHDQAQRHRFHGAPHPDRQRADPAVRFAFRAVGVSGAVRSGGATVAGCDRSSPPRLTRHLAARAARRSSRAVPRPAAACSRCINPHRGARPWAPAQGVAAGENRRQVAPQARALRQRPRLRGQENIADQPIDAGVPSERGEGIGLRDISSRLAAGGARRKREPTPGVDSTSSLSGYGFRMRLTMLKPGPSPLRATVAGVCTCKRSLKIGRCGSGMPIGASHPSNRAPRASWARIARSPDRAAGCPARP